MDYLLARIRDRRNGMRLLLSDRSIYCVPDMLDCALPYSPSDALEESEWFYLDQFTQQQYCLDVLKKPFNGTRYPLIKDEELASISFLCYVHDADIFCFQRVSKSQLLKRKRIVFSGPIRYEDDSREIIVNALPDAIYRKSDDRLFFKKLSSITSIFSGIDEAFREATEEETSEFLEQDFIVLGGDYDSSHVKKPNRKRIALAKEALDGYDAEQWEAVLNSIRDYYPSIVRVDGSFRINTDEDLTYLLYGILQRFYTTADGRKKRIARAVREIG